jgi:hypothetical protein
MTPKEKAMYLCERFPYRMEESKEYALFVVDEILSVMNSLFTESYLDNLDENKYWQQVKKEIEIL